MLNLTFNVFGIMLTAAAVYGAMDGQIIVPIGSFLGDARGPRPNGNPRPRSARWNPVDPSAWTQPDLAL
jgi:hypothetical protein